jgi:transposase InsO family protein
MGNSVGKRENQILEGRDLMPWDETTRMSQRVRFIADFESCLYTMMQLCERYSISRKTGYKWAERFGKEGVEGLKDRSRAPKSCAHGLSDEVSERLLKLRRSHPTWGPRKLLAWLQKREPETSWPAASTVGGLLKRKGLVEARVRRRRPWPPSGPPTIQAAAANAVWCCDFKGQFRTGDGELCYPLTVTDGYSRFLLGVQGLDSVAESLAWPVFERLFQEYGLPEAMRSDNGSPFASASALARLSRLSVRWLKLGIRLERIEPGHPEQNGRHERMHRTLKQETARPPAESRGAQQERFDQFREVYNEQRPHEALGQQTPAEFYRPSPRPYPSEIPKSDYPGHFEVRSVRHGGEIQWQGQFLFLSEALARERVGLEECADGIWDVYFGSLLLARFDERERKLYGG